ncbi:YbbR-like domain-containing protein [Psychroflexus aestuariivivens]|uniref:hypothetical protein n=1 Tax=Psychroflexus aestuariivivens TaxID=1795040 RepID=UPI000FD745CC|nr:hypothetical protein [Psychroflexus aestuariivivens]
MNKNRQFKTIKTNLSKRNYKAFIFFLCFTLLIWIFVQLSKNYNQTVEFNFEITNTPKDIVVEKKSKSVDFQLNETGFKLLSLNLFNQNYRIDFKHLKVEDAYLTYDLYKDISEIVKKFNLSESELKLTQSTLNYEYYKLKTKKIKVIPNLQVEFKLGYDSVQNFKVMPKMVKISGKDSILKEIDSVHTISKTFTDVSDTLSGKIQLKTEDFELVNFFTTQVEYQLVVDRFTEGKVQVPIKVVNLPQYAEVTTFPKTVEISFKTSLSNFEKIDENDFTVECEYKEDEDFMIPKIVEHPKSLKHLNLNINKVDYLVKK